MIVSSTNYTKFVLDTLTVFTLYTNSRANKYMYLRNKWIKMENRKEAKRVVILYLQI